MARAVAARRGRDSGKGGGVRHTCLHDGHAVARAFKDDATLAAIPIVAVTSYAMAGDREKCLAAGAEGYIEKPINPESFAAEVERFLRPTGRE